MLTAFKEGKKYVFRKALHDTDVPSNADANWPVIIDGMTVSVESVKRGSVGCFTVTPKWCEEVIAPTATSRAIKALQDYWDAVDDMTREEFDLLGSITFRLGISNHAIDMVKRGLQGVHANENRTV